MTGIDLVKRPAQAFENSELGLEVHLTSGVKYLLIVTVKESENSGTLAEYLTSTASSSEGRSISHGHGKSEDMSSTCTDQSAALVSKTLSELKRHSPA